MGAITPLHLLIVLIVALLVLGPGKLPEVGAALGKTIREFRKAATDVQEATSLNPTPTIPAASSAVPAASPVAPAVTAPAAADPPPVAAAQAPSPSGDTVAPKPPEG
ncbi:MAG TPA: twin-arginine translocase TatA/TatE family subunit [Gaiellales bacterium]|nr:twin-arginine translocase TatA/TatE family subunit [Gaiellales bacterium]